MMNNAVVTPTTVSRYVARKRGRGNLHFLNRLLNFRFMNGRLLVFDLGKDRTSGQLLLIGLPRNGDLIDERPIMGKGGT
jgi:hypothetical protein